MGHRDLSDYDMLTVMFGLYLDFHLIFGRFTMSHNYMKKNLRLYFRVVISIKFLGLCRWK